MSKRTQKTGVSARFGSRYGVSVRRNAGKVLRKKNAQYTCPSCHYSKVTRKSTGIWLCKKCGHNFTGGAWEPYTRASEANNRIIRRGIEGATTSDMALIAVEAAIKYERDIAKSEEE